MNELDLYLAVLTADLDAHDLAAAHAAFWRRDTDFGTLYMLAMVYGVALEAEAV